MGGQMGGQMGGVMQGGLPPGQQPGQQPAHPQARNNNIQVQQHIYKQLVNQELPPGWQTTVTPQTRTTNVFQLVSSLRLIKPDMSVVETVGVAMGYERKTFLESPDKNTYEMACRNKLQEIALTRNNQAQRLQEHLRLQSQQNQQAQQNQQTSQNPHMNMMQQQIPLQSGISPNFVNGFQQNFPQQAMQVSSMGMQNQPSQQQNFVQMGNGMPNNQMSMQPNRPMSRNMAQPNPGGPQMTLTPEDNAQIAQLAQKLAQDNRNQHDSIRERLNSVSNDQKQAWEAQGVDPLAVYFRRQATAQFGRMKQARMRQLAEQQMSQNNIGQAGMGVNPHNTGQGAHLASRPMQSSQMQASNQQNGAGASSQSYDPSFNGNIQQNLNQILDLQQDALRHQESGQVVVPASNNQIVSQQQSQQRGFTPATPMQQTVSQQSGARPASGQGMTSQQQAAQAQRMQQQRLQNAAQMSNQAPAMNNNPSQNRGNLQGQVGGLNANTGQGPAQQSPAMPNLNRPMRGPNQQPMMQGSNQSTPRQRPPPPGQAKPTDQAMMQQVSQQQAGPPRPLSVAQAVGGQQGAISISGLPQQMQQKLMGMPEQQRAGILALWQQKQMEQRMKMQNMQNANRPGAPGAPTPGSSANQPPFPMGQVGQPMTPQGSAPTAAVFNQQQNPMQFQNQPGQNMMGQQQLQDVFQNRQAANLRNMQNAASTLSEENTRRMDQQVYPPNILSSHMVSQQLPQEVRTWGQLKAWVTRNTHSMPADILDKLKGLQALHFQNLVQQEQAKQNNQQSRLPGQRYGPAPPAQMGQPSSVPVPVPQPNAPQAAMPGQMPQLPRPTMQELQATRMRLPAQMKNITDEQLSVIIQRHRYQAMMKNNQVQTSISNRPTNDPGLPMTQQQPQPQPQSQSQPQPPQRLPMQSNQPPKPQPTPQPAAQNIKRANAQPVGKVNQQPTRPGNQNANMAQQNSKNNKRGNDDVIEVPNPNIAQQQQRNQVTARQAPGQQKHNVPQAEEPQKSQYEAELRNQAMQRAQQPAPNNRNQAELARQNDRLNRIIQEVTNKMPSRPPVPMDPQTRNMMGQKLRETQKMVSRMEESLPMFFRMTGDEKLTRDLVATVGLSPCVNENV